MREGRDRILFARSLRGVIAVRNLSTEGDLTITGRGYGKRGSKNFGRVVIRGPRQGTTLGLGEIGARSSVRELFLERVSVHANESTATIRDSHLDGRSTVTGRAGVDGEFVYGHEDERLAVFGTTVTGFGVGVTAYKSRVRIDESRISGNLGPGVALNAYYSGFQITNSTISGNDGGGVSGGGSVSNSTIAYNGDGRHRGGGVFGAVSVNESTIVGNTATVGGGVASDNYNGPAEISNSIVYGNRSTAPGAAGDCDKDVRSTGGNLFGDASDCATKHSDVIGRDPILGELAFNGGETRTFALGRRSPAIGLAERRKATKFDQRGERRDKHPDAGAYER